MAQSRLQMSEAEQLHYNYIEIIVRSFRPKAIVKLKSMLQARSFRFQLISIAIVLIATSGSTPASDDLLTITTPDQFEQLKSGQIGADYNRVLIKPNAHPQVLLQPKFFWNAPFAELTFQDVSNNQIVIMPPFQNVFGSFQMGANLTLGVPDNYKNYLLFFDRNVNLTEADFNYMFEWKKAERLGISDERDVANELLNRVDAMSKMRRLRSLTINVDRNLYKIIRVRPFLTKLPSLRHAFIEPKALSESETIEFVQSQKIPWTWKTEVKRSVITYSKRWWCW